MKNIINISIIGLFALLISCKTSTSYQSVSDSERVFKFPVITDTSYFKTSKQEETWLTTANYKLLYFGEWKDTIYPDFSLKYYAIPLPPPSGSDIEPSDTIGFHKKLTEHKMYPYYIDWHLISTNHGEKHKFQLL